MRLSVLLLCVLCTSVKSQDKTNKLIEFNKTDSSEPNMDLQKIFKKVKSYIRFVPVEMFLKTEDEFCNAHLKMLLDGLLDMKIWAVRKCVVKMNGEVNRGCSEQVFDSSAKLPDGINEGHLVHFGNFDECIGESEPSGEFQGKSCIIKLSLSPDADFYDVLKLTPFGKNATQYIEDNIFNSPFMLFSTCIPSSCSADNFNKIVNDFLEQQNIPLVPNIEEKYCSTSPEKSADSGDWITIAIIILFSAIVIVSSYYDFITSHSVYRCELLMTFSMYKNGSMLMETSEKSMRCLHGIRFLSAFWLLIGHTYTFLLIEASNSLHYLEDLVSWRKIVVTNTFLSSDTFFLLSGLFLSYYFLNNMEKRNLRDFNIFLFYLRRYIRLTPLLAVTILITATIVRIIDSGPVWKTAIDFYTESCRNNWWPPLLYIQNYLNLPMCLPHTWYLAVDSQLYLLSPIILILLWKKPKLGVLLSVSLIIAGIITVFVLAYVNEEHFVLAEAMKRITSDENIFQLNFSTAFDTFGSYIKTHTRFPSWVIGVLLGYALHKCGSVMWKPSKIVVLGGWACCIILTVSAVCFAYPLMQIHYEYNVWEVSFYLAFHRIAWCLGMCWMIFACISGYGGILNTFLSLKCWIPLSRLSYALCLIHPVIMYTGASRIRGSMTYYDTNCFLAVTYNFGLSIAAALFLNMLFESPFITFYNTLLKGSRCDTKSEIPSYEDHYPKGNNESMTVD